MNETQSKLPQAETSSPMTDIKLPREVRLPHHRQRVQAEGGGESDVDQSFALVTDVNDIVARYARTGELPPATRTGRFGDVTGLQGDLTDRLLWAKTHLDMAKQAYETLKQAQKDEQSEPQTSNEPEAPQTTTEPQNSVP